MHAIISPGSPGLQSPGTRTLVVIPTYNEASNLSRLVPAVLAVDPDLDVLVIDDASPDGTGDIADSMARDDARIRVLHRPGKLGLGTAYVDGFADALARGYARVVEMDADFSHRPEDLPALLEATSGPFGAHVAIGSRLVPGGTVIGWSILRHAVSKGGSLLARLALGLPVRDCTSGFKCFQRAALEAVSLTGLRSNGFAFQIEVNYACSRAGLRLVEVPIRFRDRLYGTSKMSWPIVAEAIWMLLALRVGRIWNSRPAESHSRPRHSRDVALHAGSGALR